MLTRTYIDVHVRRRNVVCTVYTTSISLRIVVNFHKQKCHNLGKPQLTVSKNLKKDENEKFENVKHSRSPTVEFFLLAICSTSMQKKVKGWQYSLQPIKNVFFITNGTQRN